MALTSLFKIAAREALKKGASKSVSKMRRDYVPSPEVDETTDVLKALGKKEKDIVEFRQPKKEGGQKLEGSEKEVYRNPELEEEARKLDEGLITLGEFKEMRDILKPRRTYGTVPKLYENFDIVGSLPGSKAKDVGIVGVNKNLKSGELISSRFDIPAYRDYGRYVVTIRKDGDLFGYAPTAILKDVKFTGNPNVSKFSKVKDPGKKSFKIAQGKSKSPFAVMEGKWQNMSPESTHKYAEDLMDAGKVNKYGEVDKEWTEIGFDPASKSSFYNRSTGEPIFAADKVIQVGPMLLARGIKKPTKEQLKSIRFITKDGKEHEGYKHGGKIMAGGLSNLKKSININGQPHSLAWINPDEASVLKAMGGSGKPGPMGIPSYQEADPDAYVDASANIQDTVGPDEGGYSWNWGSTGGYDYSTDEKADPGRDVETGYSDQELIDYAAGLGTTVRGLGPIGTERATAEHHDQLTDMRKGILGLYGDRMTRGEVLDKAKSLGYTTWRNTAGRYSDDPEKDYDKWFADQDPTALIAGYRVGDPVGKAMQQSFDIINTQLANKFKTAREEMESISGEKELSEGTIKNLAEEAGVKDFKSYSGIDYPWYKPGGILAKGINFLSRTVAGTGTVGGVGVHVHKDGTVTPISPEDSPGYDHESMRGENVEAPIRRRIPQQKVSVSESITEEEPLTGMKGLLARRSKPSTRIQSNTFLSNLLDDIYGSDREKLLG